MATGKVSFIIAAFNEELFIHECIISCLNQTHSDIEVCITDDGSTDNTWAILEQLATDIRVKIKKFDKNQGKVAAFNSSFEMATGDYIAIIGADDVNLTDRVTSQLNHIQETKSDLVWGGLEVTDEHLNRVSISLIEGIVKTNMKDILEQNNVSGGTILMKRDFASSLFPLPTTLAFEDWWIGYKAIANGNVSYLKKVLIKYRQHNNNAAGGSDKSTIEQLRNNYKRHFDFYRIVRKDLEKKFIGPDKSKLLTVIDGAIAYRELCLAGNFLSRLAIFVNNWKAISSLSALSIMKSFVFTLIGAELFLKVKAVIK